jgi:hypothetical protein
MMNFFTRITAFFLTITLIITWGSVQVFANNPRDIKMMLNGRIVSTPWEAPPYIENGRTMVPVRFISEALGADVGWNETARLVTVTSSDGTLVKLTIGNQNMIIEKPGTTSNTLVMDVAAIIKDGWTFVPVRCVAEALELKVGWNDNISLISFATADYQELTPPRDFPDGFIYLEEYKPSGDYGGGLSPREAALRTIEPFLAREVYSMRSYNDYVAPERPIYVIFANMEGNGYIFHFVSGDEHIMHFMVSHDGIVYESAGRGLYMLYEHFQ